MDGAAGRRTRWAGRVTVRRTGALGGLVQPAGLPRCRVVETFRDEVVSFADQIRRSSGSAELHIWPGGLSRLRHARTGPAAIPRCSSRATGLAASHTRRPVRGVSGADIQRPTTALLPQSSARVTRAADYSWAR